MNTVTQRYVPILFLLFSLTLLIPRILLWQNGTDRERMSDTLTRDTIELLQAGSNHTLVSFFQSDHKYPLLGAYLSIPAVTGAYFFEKWQGKYTDSAGFACAFVLDQTKMHLWLRFEMLIISLLGIYFLFRTLRLSNPNEPLVAWIGAILATVSFYGTVFSVAPRIHSWAFFFSALTLFFTVRYYKDPTFSKALIAFLAGGLTFAVSQSGLVAIALPLVAVILVPRTLSTVKEKWKIIFKELCGGLLLAILTACILGYPKLFSVLFEQTFSFTNISHVFLNPIHSQPSFGFGGIGVLLSNLFGTEFIFLGTAILAFVYVAKHRRLPFVLLDHITVIPVIAFFILFGLTSVASGRFLLVILPLIFFVTARFLGTQLRGVWARAFIFITVFVQLFLIVQLSVMASRPDTRYATVEHLLHTTDTSTNILATIDHHSLGLPLHPASLALIPPDDLGATDALIIKNGLVSERSRKYRYWDPDQESLTAKDLMRYNVIIFDEYRQREAWQEELTKSGFRADKVFVPHRFGVNEYSFNWDSFGSGNMLELFSLKSFGPPLFIFRR